MEDPPRKPFGIGQALLKDTAPTLHVLTCPLAWK